MTRRRRPKKARTNDRHSALLHYPRVTKFESHAWGWKVMSPILIGTGFAIFLVSIGVIEVDGANAPMWVVGCFGMDFFLAGLLTFIRGLRHTLRRRRLARAETLHPDEPWFADHEWDPQGTVTRLGYAGFEHVFGVVLSIGLLAPVNWIAFYADSDSAFSIAALLFDAIFLIVLGFQVREFFARRKYGRPYLAFESFPARPGSIFRGWLVYDKALGGVRRLTITLRLIEESWSDLSTSQSTQRSVMCYSRYSDTLKLGPIDARAISDGGLEIEFPIPSEAKSSALSRYPARYWDLEVIADRPGINFRQHFLIPVYEY